MLQNEKTRSLTLMNEIEKLSTQGDHADQLELSLLVSFINKNYFVGWNIGLFGLESS